MKHLYKLLLSSLFVLSSFLTQAQTGTDFWFAAPEVSEGHAGDTPIVLRLATGDQPCQVTIEQPARNNVYFNGTIPANSTQTVDLSDSVEVIETKPGDVVLDYGLHVSSDNPMTVYYEANAEDNNNNPEIFPLKAQSGLGTEFYTPFQDLWENGTYTPQPYSSIEIVATEDNTNVLISPSAPVVGHPAGMSYFVSLDEGESYSVEDTNSQNTVDNLSGTIVSSNKDVAVTLKDGSIGANSGGCRDIMGDQLVPTDVIGREYIVNRGYLDDPDEQVFIVATENYTQIDIGGTNQATINAGETYSHQIPDGQDFTYVEASKPIYVLHASGFGCEHGAAILPPLNCAGSDRVNFVRSSSESFYLNLLIKSGSEGDFTLNGDPNLVQAGDFQPVPNTGGDWVGARLQFNTSEVPVNSSSVIENSSDIFSMGLINGGPTTGCRFGYFSEYVSETVVDAGPDESYCANVDVPVSGTISGGTNSGEWTTSGSGGFADSSSLSTTYFPSAADTAAGSVDLYLASTDICFPETDTMTLTLTDAPKVDAGTDRTVCENSADVDLHGDHNSVPVGVQWSGGSGSFSPGNTDTGATYSPTAGEISSGSVTLKLTSTGNGGCNAVEDSMSISFTDAPVVEAGDPDTVCANDPDLNLDGSVSGPTSTGQWSGGSGSFSPGPSDLNATYTPSSSEITAGSVTLTLTSTNNGDCAPVTDDVEMTITGAPQVDAGSDQTLCANNGEVSLNGSVTGGASTGQWTTSGTGSFDPNNTDLNGTYIPSAADTSSGSVDLILTSTNNGRCLAERDTMTVTYTDAPKVEAGADQTVCANNATVSLNGSVSAGSSTGIWSTSGSGSFTNASDLNTDYDPSPADTTAGSVWLTLTSTANGNCTPVEDSLQVTITEAPVVEAGPADTVCSNNADITLNGSVSNASGGSWSGGAGTFSPGNTSLSTTYSPTAAEIASGSLTLTLTSTGNGDCNAESDDVTIEFSPSPSVDAGADESVCANNAEVDLNGSVTGGASTGQWSTDGTGSFSPDNSTLNATYVPSDNDTSSGSVQLVLSSTNNGDCLAESDTMNITYTDAPTVDAGADQTVCANDPDVNLNGSVSSPATGGTWTGGSGSFSPSNSALNATYTPSSSEISAGSAKLYLTTTGNGDCNAVTDSMSITITPSPVVDAGPDDSVCSNDPSIGLSGSVTNAGGGQWSGGSGSFDDPTDLNTSYDPSSSEIASGSVTLTLTSTGNGDCLAEDDDITITFTPSPVVDAGVDDTVCANNAELTLNGSVTGGATTGEWTTSGTGSFIPNDTVLNATYVPSDNDTSNGSVELYLSSTNNGDCLAESDTMEITYSDAPPVEAGSDVTVCANASTVSLNGSVGAPATGGQWSGGGTFSPDASTLNADYTPSASEISAGSATLYLTSTGNGDCNAVTDSMEITITPAPVVDAGNDTTTCVDQLDIPLDGSVSGATSTGQWSTNGTGVFTPNNTDLNATYEASSQDSINGNVTIYLSSTNNGNCVAETDSMQINIFPGGSATVGSDRTVCANDAEVDLNGSVSGNASGGIWSSSGTGSFSPDSSTLDPTYIPSDADTAAGNVTLTLTANSCDLDSDSLEVTITDAPKVDAGTDIITCVDDLDVDLNGSVVGGTNTGEWQSTGTGSFVPNNSTLNATYEASSADSANEGATLILSSTNNGNCLPESDTIELDIKPGGIANAGSDATVCANNAEHDLNGNVAGGASEGLWTSSGSGSFVPDDTSMNATYVPSPADTAAGSVWLKLEATNSCNPAEDSLQLTITDAPTVEVGNDTALCKNNATLPLSGSFSGSSGVVWNSTGSGSFLPSSTDPNASYDPSGADLSTGSVQLSLTTTGNGDCNPVSDTLDVDYTASPQVDAGADQSVCELASSTQLFGNVSGGTNSGQWSTVGSTGGTFSPNSTTLNAEYLISSGDTAAGFVDLVLTSTNNGNCDTVRDTMTISFGNTPYVEAGPDQGVCASDLTANLNGTVAGGSSDGYWETLGSGSFSPDSSVLGADYTMSSSDSSNGSVQLVLHSTNSGSCNETSDTLSLNVEQPPTADAGSDKVACPGSPAGLSGSVSNASGGQWSTSGSGSFQPNDSTLTASYVPSSADSIAGSVDLTLTTTGNGVCPPASDTTTLTIEVPVDADFSYSTPCVNSPVSFSDQTTTTSGSVNNLQWDIDGSIFNGSSPSFTFSSTGIYDVKLVATSSLGCKDSVTQSLGVNPLPEVAFNSNVECPGDTVFFSDSSSIPAGNMVSWDWDFGDDSTATGQDPAHLYDTSGTYDVTLSVSSNSGCVDSATEEVSVGVSEFAEIHYEADCPPDRILFTDTSQTGADSVEEWNWSFGDGDTSSLEDPSHDYDGAGTYTASLSVLTEKGCRDTTFEEVTVTAGPEAGFSFEGQGEEPRVGEPVDFFDESSNAGTWQWDFGDNSLSSTERNPDHVYTEEGRYPVTQIVQNSDGCRDTAVNEVIVAPGNEVHPPALPTGFSPNNDGNNDVLRVRGGPFESLDFKVYNKWGDLLFRSREQDNGWDGTYEGKAQPTGEYVYTIDARTIDGESYSFSGNVALIR